MSLRKHSSNTESTASKTQSEQIKSHVGFWRGGYKLEIPEKALQNRVGNNKLNPYLTIRLRARVFYEQIVNEAH